MNTHPMYDQLEQLRTELIDRAYLLDRCGRADAADLANELAGRIGELIAGAAGAAGDTADINISAACCPERSGSFVR
jgi:hypothetical protein